MFASNPIQRCSCQWLGFASEAAPQGHCPRCQSPLMPAAQQHIDALRQEQHRLFKINHPRSQTWSVAQRRAEHARINALLDRWYHERTLAALEAEHTLVEPHVMACSQHSATRIARV